MIPTFSIPTPPPEPTDRSYPSWRDWVLNYASVLYNYVSSYVAEWVRQFNLFLVGYGPDLASATSITVGHAVHQVTGTTPVQTILQPTGQTAVGVLALIAKDGFSLVSGGNISAPANVVVPSGGAAILVYHPVLKEWFTGLSQKGTFSAIYVLADANTPFAVPAGTASAPVSLLIAVNLTSVDFTANLPSTPAIGDTATFFVQTNPNSHSLNVVPAGGQTIDGISGAHVLSSVNHADSLIYAASNTWLIYANAN